MKRLSEQRKGSGNPMFGKHSWNYGIPMTDKVRQILKEANTGRPCWNKGKKWSEEAKLKMSLSAMGKKRPRTAEHQRKLSESRIRNNKLRKELAA